MVLTQSLTEVLLFLHTSSDEWVQPTTVGTEVGKKPYNGASSWGSAKLKALVNLGFAFKDGGRYAITLKGTQAAEALEVAKGG